MISWYDAALCEYAHGISENPGNWAGMVMQACKKRLSVLPAGNGGDIPIRDFS
jgi:hypothetical protein